MDVFPNSNALMLAENNRDGYVIDSCEGFAQIKAQRAAAIRTAVHLDSFQLKHKQTSNIGRGFVHQASGRNKTCLIKQNVI